MNEEIKIIIKAVTDNAKKGIADVKKELENIEKQGKNASSQIDNAMAVIAKGALATVAAITALTAAMAKLGKTAQELEKGFAKLNTTFGNMGMTTQQATQTYKDLFSFLGDHDKAIESAQSLALITQEEEKLAEWSNILQGAFAQMGEKLPTESLAEAANETIKVSKVTGVMADALNWMGVSEDAFNEALAQTTSLEEREALVRNTLNGLYGSAAQLYSANNQATIEYNQSQANLNIALAEAAAYTAPLITALNNLGTTLLTSFGGALRTVALYLTAFIQLLGEAIAWVGNFFGVTSSKTESVTSNVRGYRSAMNSYLNSLQNGFTKTGKGIDDTINKVNELKRQTMGFDELNVVSSQTTASVGGLGGGAGAGIVGGLGNIPSASDYGLGADIIDLSGFQADLETAKEHIKAVLVLVGLVAAALIVWKIAQFISDLKLTYDAMKAITTLAGKVAPEAFEKAFGKTSTQMLGEVKEKQDSMLGQLKKMGGLALTIAGAFLLIKGYASGWADGVDWANLALVIGGAALACTGLGIAFGALAAQIGVIVAGAAMMILGFKDITENGVTVQNTILIIGGAIATAVALATMGVAPLIAAIVAVTAAVAAFVAGILLEKPAILSTKEAQEQLNAAKQAAADAENNYINAVDAAESALNRLKAAEEAAGMTGAELYAQVQSGALDYANMTAEQKELYKAYIDNEKKQADLKASTEAFNEAKKAETLASYENQLALAKESGDYDKFKESVVEAFEKGELTAEEARDLISKSMSEMSDDAQQAFLKDIPGDIKNGLDPHKYESTGTKIKKWFSNTWADIKKGFSDAGAFFKEVGTKFGEALSGAFKKVVNTILEKIEGMINGFFRLINSGIDIINKIPGVSISKLEMVELPRLAKGGITTGSTIANIGEAGKEAVLPLENHTEWMDILADRIASRNSAPSKVVLMVDGRELGYAAINNINGITKQTGNLQLILA